jgi:hypothetical protein
MVENLVQVGFQLVVGLINLSPELTCVRLDFLRPAQVLRDILSQPIGLLGQFGIDHFRLDGLQCRGWLKDHHFGQRCRAALWKPRRGLLWIRLLGTRRLIGLLRLLRRRPTLRGLLRRGWPLLLLLRGSAAGRSPAEKFFNFVAICHRFQVSRSKFQVSSECIAT